MQQLSVAEKKDEGNCCDSRKINKENDDEEQQQIKARTRIRKADESVCVDVEQQGQIIKIKVQRSSLLTFKQLLRAFSKIIIFIYMLVIYVCKNCCSYVENTCRYVDASKTIPCQAIPSTSTQTNTNTLKKLLSKISHLKSR